MRRELDYTIRSKRPEGSVQRPESRDEGKVFRLREMSAAAAESWAVRAFLALARNGVEVPDDIANAGLAGIAALGVRLVGQMRYEDAEPLLEEMMTCVKRVPDPSKPEVTRALVDDDIEEVATRLELRRAVFELHLGFSLADAASKSAATSASSKGSADSPSTRTSHARSAR